MVKRNTHNVGSGSFSGHSCDCETKKERKKIKQKLQLIYYGLTSSTSNLIKNKLKIVKLRYFSWTHRPRKTCDV